MFCKKCGTEIPNGSNRCENCGFELIHATQTLPVEQDNEKSAVIMGNEEQNHIGATQYIQSLSSSIETHGKLQIK